MGLKEKSFFTLWTTILVQINFCDFLNFLNSSHLKSLLKKLDLENFENKNRHIFLTV